MTEMKFICLYRNYSQVFDKCSDRQIGTLIRAMFQYVDTAQEPELTGTERVLWPLLKFRLDQDIQEYEKKVEKNRRNGEKGGRPRKNTGEESQENPPVFSETQKRQEE